MELPQPQVDVLRALAQQPGACDLALLVQSLRLDQSLVKAACDALEQHGLITSSEAAFEELSLGPEGTSFLDQPLPERTLVSVLRKLGGQARIVELPSHCPLNAAQVGQTLRWLAQRGWAVKSGEMLILADLPTASVDELQPDELVIQALRGGRVARRAQLEQQGLPVAAALELLSKRKGFIVVKPRTDRFAQITPRGQALLAAGVTGKRRVTQLSPELLSGGGWHGVELAPYDVTLAAKTVFPGKSHPFQRTLDKVRRVFLELGFTEVVSPWVESSFWDFDALFQPQDHPARDMQDTFYVGRPEQTRLPDAQLVERVRRTHEDGGETDSTGWRYRWQRELASKPVLRTHTTAATIRALAAHAADRGGQAGKYFVIGPVFRRETVDYKHLPVFHQVDGIIVDRQANLSTLLGTLQAFYGKMGYPKLRFRPSFFPYTEPSAEVYLWLEQRREWVEMGGSGIFRPEVTHPLGIQERVLAWGLGLERLAMMIHGLQSIGELYFASMPWLREAPACRA